MKRPFCRSFSFSVLVWSRSNISLVRCVVLGHQVSFARRPVVRRFFLRAPALVGVSSPSIAAAS